MAFDTIQELFWVGNDYVRIHILMAHWSKAHKVIIQGRVASFYSSELQRHTSFRAHPSGDGPVRQLLCHDKGIIALGTKSIHMATRRGLPVWHIEYVFSH